MLIEVQALHKTYETPAGAFRALRGVDLVVAAGEFVAVVGKSGSGKSTLLNMMAGIDRPTAGTVRVAGAAIEDMSEDGLAVWRGSQVGLVFQFFQLLPTLTVAENVMLPMDFRRSLPAAARSRRALDLLERVGIAEHAHKLPSGLSGGQQQRAAIARALANTPPLILADEPTGNLDSATARDVLGLFRDLAAGGTTVVIATHERDLETLIDRTISLVDGRVAG